MIKINWLYLKNIFGGKIFNLSHKNTAIAAGTAAQMVLINGAISIQIDPYRSIILILYAFLIMMPMAYYNMRNHETEGQREWA